MLGISCCGNRLQKSHENKAQRKRRHICYFFVAVSAKRNAQSIDLFTKEFKALTEIGNSFNNDNNDPEVKAQVIVLQYLLFRFMNNDTRGYIYTYELKDQLANTELRNMKDQAFRMRIIGKLRDKGVIIASSQKGYKIPSKQAELYDFINHDAKIVIPMLARLKKCRDLVKLGTANELDLLDHPEYRQLQVFFDSLPEETASQL